VRYALVEKLEIIMSSYAGKYIGSTPQHYDEFLGPLIFVDYAADIAQRVAAGNPFVKGYVRFVNLGPPALSAECPGCLR
jgi:hypothetical protein